MSFDQMMDAMETFTPFNAAGVGTPKTPTNTLSKAKIRAAQRDMRISIPSSTPKKAGKTASPKDIAFSIKSPTSIHSPARMKHRGMYDLNGVPIRRTLAEADLNALLDSLSVTDATFPANPTSPQRRVRFVSSPLTKRYAHKVTSSPPPSSPVLAFTTLSDSPSPMSLQSLSLEDGIRVHSRGGSWESDTPPCLVLDDESDDEGSVMETD